ncbi:hypothetical protein E2562_000525 [Oryza meyeriana var. granulata]|uniref:CCHC-type domain-containing protein n=1 Tax=Oryza meyeriana var. granulata TaxID=110450 RepID=A0A6G1CC88_9ORYZ|nr:hypothetical protein E2562_000525 [Oryza meyeriana var. granulata]
MSVQGYSTKISVLKLLKPLSALRPGYDVQVAISIEQLLDVNNMPMEELVGRLSKVDNRSDDEEDNWGELFLIEEQWLACMKQNEQDGSSGSGSGGSGGQNNRRTNTSSPKGKKAASGSVGGRDHAKVKCFNCNDYGHYAKQCRKPWCQRKGEANLTQGGGADPAHGPRCGSVPRQRGET